MTLEEQIKKEVNNAVIDVAKRLIAMSLTDELVAEATDLPLDEIASIRKNVIVTSKKDELETLIDRDNWVKEKKAIQIAKNLFGLLPVETISARTGVPMEELNLIMQDMYIEQFEEMY